MLAVTNERRADGRASRAFGGGAAWVVGIVTALGVVGAGRSWGLVGAAVAWSLGWSACAAISDHRTSRLPNELVVAGAVPVVVLGMFGLSVGSVALMAGALAGAALYAVPLLVLHALSPAAMGFGDVKFAAALGVALGAVAPRLAVGALCVASGLAVAWGAARRQSSVPFGPCLWCGSIMMLAVAMTAGWGPMPWR